MMNMVCRWRLFHLLLTLLFTETDSALANNDTSEPLLKLIEEMNDGSKEENILDLNEINKVNEVSHSNKSNVAEDGAPIKRTPEKNHQSMKQSVENADDSNGAWIYFVSNDITKGHRSKNHPLVKLEGTEDRGYSSEKRSVRITKKDIRAGSKNGYGNEESIDYQDGGGGDVENNTNGYINDVNRQQENREKKGIFQETGSLQNVKENQSGLRRVKRELGNDGHFIYRSKRFMLPLGTGSRRHSLLNTFHQNLKNIKQEREQLRNAGMNGIHLNFPFLKGHNMLCGDKTCHKDAECYRRKCRCRRGLVGDGVNSCSHVCKCTVSGDPHFHTFDGETIHLMSDCKHILSESLNFKDGCDFRIEIKNEKRGTNKFVSWPRSLDFHIYNLTVRLGPHHKTFVNNEEKYLPLTTLEGKLHIFKSSKSIQVTTGCGVQVSFNGDDFAEIQIPQRYGGRMRGLCGDCNGIKDDIRTKDGLDVRSVNNKYSLIGLSYLINETSATSHSCTAHDFVTHCSPTTEALYASPIYCGFIIDKQSVFDDCYTAYPDLAQQFFDSCMFDVCAYESDNTTITKSLCGNIEAFAQLCLEYGYMVDWRDKEFCPMSCPAGQHYSLEVSGCPGTCSEPDAAEKCSLPEREGCQCEPGKLLSGTECVFISDCGCFQNNGEYIPVGKTLVTENCSSILQCKKKNGHGEMEVYKMKCAKHAECVLRDGEHVCQCLQNYKGNGSEKCTLKHKAAKRNNRKLSEESSIDTKCSDCHPHAICVLDKCKCTVGYVGDGVNTCKKEKCGDKKCHRNGRCQVIKGVHLCTCNEGYTGNGVDICDEGHCTCFASGDPHYRTYDSNSLYLVGDCKYVMSRTVDNVKFPFCVEVKNEHRNTSSPMMQAFTRLVDVKINDHVYRLHLTKYLTVDGKKMAIPYKTNDGKINITIEGYYMKLEFGGGLIVRFDGLHKVVISLGKQYAKKVEGICGDCDSNPANDILFNGKDLAELVSNSERYEKFASQFLLTDDSDKPAKDEICYMKP